MKERFGATNPRAMMLRFHTQTGGSTLTAQQPLNNIVRVAIQTLAAVLGGTQSLHTNSYDEALALPTEESVRIALRTQQVVAHESGVAETVDPLAGSYYVEAKTNDIENQALDYIEKIDLIGGMVRAIEQGYVQKEIQASSYRYLTDVEKKERIIVGVNEFTAAEAHKPDLLKIDFSVQEQQLKRLQSLKEKRDNEKVTQTLTELKKTAQGTKNTMPTILNAVRAYATLGEISDVLREVFGEYKETIVI